MFLFVFLPAARLHTGMTNTTFKDWLAQHDEGFLLPDGPPLNGMTRINAFPGTDADRKRFHVKPPKPFAPTVRKVREIVPNKLIPKLKDPATVIGRGYIYTASSFR